MSAKTERNIAMRQKVLNGESFSAVGKDNSITDGAVRMIVLRDCKRIDRDLFLSCIDKGSRNPKLKMLRSNKSVFNAE